MAVDAWQQLKLSSLSETRMSRLATPVSSWASGSRSETVTAVVVASPASAEHPYLFFPFPFGPGIQL